jgi:hypothetical protein
MEQNESENSGAKNAIVKYTQNGLLEPLCKKIYQKAQKKRELRYVNINSLFPCSLFSLTTTDDVLRFRSFAIYTFVV